jgi:PAS domain S-box-containing protein
VDTEWPYDPDDSLEVGVSGRAVITGLTAITPDYLKDTVIVHGAGPDSYVRAKGIRGVIASPLVAGDGVFGAITVWSCKMDAFDAADASLLETIAGQAAVALLRARLVEDLGRSREELARRADEVRALYDLARRSMTASGPGGAAGVLEDVADVAARLLGRLGAVIEVVGPAADRGTLRRAADLDPADVAEWRRGPGADAIAQAVSTQRVVMGGWAGPGPIRSWAVAPLNGESSAWGTIAVLSDEPDRYTTPDAELLGALADHAAIALAGADLLERLEQSEDRYRSLIENLPDIVFTCAADGMFTFLSESVEALLGWSPEQLVGSHFRDLIPSHLDGSPAGERFHALMANPTYKVTTRFELRTAFGFNRPVEVSAAPIVRDGRFAGIHGSARDVSERERLEADLRRQAAELAAGEERAHLARELHDSVTQALFSMTLQARSLELLLARDPSLLARKLGELRELQRDALAEMRALIFELRPGNLAEAGVVEALRTHAAGVSGRLGLPIVVESDLPERPAIEIEEALYRIAQEALHNIVKHAGAREARVELVRLGPDVRLRVTDDGHGFDPDAVPDGHLGLAGMRARAERLGGTFGVTSGIGSGTLVEAIVPNVPPAWSARTLAGAGVASMGTGRRP